MYLSDFEIGGKHGFKDGYKIVIPAQYEATSSFHNGLAIVMLNRKFGVIDTNGDFVIPNKYDDLRHLFGEFYAARINSGKDEWTCGVIDVKNSIIVPFEYKCIQSKDDKYFLCYKAAVSKTENVRYLSLNGQYSYTKQSECNWFNLNGTFLTSLDVINNNNDYLIVKNKSDKFGAIHYDGNLAIEPKYDTLEYCADDVFLATHERDNLITSYIVGNNDNVIFSTLSDIVFKNGFFLVSSAEHEEQWISVDGKVAYVGHATPLSSNYLKVYKNKKCGALDKNGEKVINFLYDDIKFCNSFFVVRREDCIGLVGLKGEVILDTVYKKLESVSIENNPLFLGSENNLGRYYIGGPTMYKGYCKEYGFDSNGHTNYNGKPCDYLCRSVISINKSYNNYLQEISFNINASDSFDLEYPIIIRTDEYAELFTIADGIIQNSRFNEIQQITKLCYVVKRNEKFGIFRIDESAISIPIEYDQIQFFGGHTVLLRKDNMWGANSLVLKKNIFHFLTKIDVPLDNLEIKILDDFQFNFGVKRVYINNYNGEEKPYYTIIDTNGKEVKELQELYLEDNFTRFDDNHYLTKCKGKYGFVSSLGYVSIPFIYDEILIRKTGSFNVRIGNAWGVIDLSGKELVRIKYAKPIPLYIAAPQNSYFDYDFLKDDIAKDVKRYNDRIIVRDALSGCQGSLDLNGNEVIPTIYDHLIFDYSNHSYGTEYNSDYLFFGYGGYKDEDLGTLFSGNIVSANWGCITKSGNQIVPPKYDYFKVVGDYICAGRDGGFAVSGQWGNMHQTDYAGVYDLYASDGEFIIGGFNKFYVQDGIMFFHFGGHWKEESDEYDYISSYFVEGNGRWLILDSNLQSLIRLKDGSKKKFEKGYKLTITTKKENNKVTNYWNAPLEIFSILEPRISYGLLVIGDGTSEKLLNPKDGSIGPNYKHITILSESFYAGINDVLVEIININGKFSDPRFLVITEPSSGYSFGVETIDDKYSRVLLIKLLSDHIESEVVISKTETDKLLDNIQYGFLRTFVSTENGKEVFSVFRPEIFDDDFRGRTIENHNLFQKKHDSVYWIGADYRLDKDYGCDYDPDYSDDNRDYMRDSWDAMTDGMYGDMPDGFDGDFDFMGR